MKRMITASWPEPLTYKDFEEGDQLIEGFLEAIDQLDLFEEASARGGSGVDMFYTSDEYNLLGSIDLDEEQQILEELYYESESEENYVKSVKNWLEDFLDLN